MRYSSSTVLTCAGGGGGSYLRGSAVFGRGRLSYATSSSPSAARTARRRPSSLTPAGSATSRAKGASGAIVAVASKTTRSPAVNLTRASLLVVVVLAATRARPSFTSRLTAPSRLAAFTPPRSRTGYQ